MKRQGIAGKDTNEKVKNLKKSKNIVSNMMKTFQIKGNKKIRP